MIQNTEAGAMKYIYVSTYICLKTWMSDVPDDVKRVVIVLLYKSTKSKGIQGICTNCSR